MGYEYFSIFLVCDLLQGTQNYKHMTYKHTTKLTVTRLKYCTAQNSYLLSTNLNTIRDAYGERFWV